MTHIFQRILYSAKIDICPKNLVIRNNDYYYFCFYISRGQNKLESGCPPNIFVYFPILCAGKMKNYFIL